MSGPLPTARLEFLKNSARTLCADSPTTAAHLLAVHNDLLFDQCKPLTASQEREFCPACGSLRTPGCTSSVTTGPGKGRGKRRPSSNPHNDDEQGQSPSASSQEGVVYKCLRCHRNVIQSFPKSRGNTHNELKRPSSISQAPSSASPTTTAQRVSTNAQGEKKSSENASSRKRAKARKNQGLLASLSAEKQQSHPPKPSSSLDLLDFLQQ